MLNKVADQAGAKFILGAPMLHPTDSAYLIEFINDGILKYSFSLLGSGAFFGYWSLGIWHLST